MGHSWNSVKLPSCCAINTASGHLFAKSTLVRLPRPQITGLLHKRSPHADRGAPGNTAAPSPEGQSPYSPVPGERPRGGRYAGDSTRFRCQTPLCGTDAHRPAMLCSEQTRDQGSGGRQWWCDRMAPAQRRAWAREPGAWSVRGPAGAGSPAPEARRAGMPCTGGRDRPTRWGHRCPGDTGRGLAASVSSGTFRSVPCTRTSGCPHPTSGHLPPCWSTQGPPGDLEDDGCPRSTRHGVRPPAPQRLPGTRTWPRGRTCPGRPAGWL